jgi:hypothetical protein
MAGAAVDLRKFTCRGKECAQLYKRYSSRANLVSRMSTSMPRELGELVTT